MSLNKVSPRASVQVSGPDGGGVTALGAGNASYVFTACEPACKMALHELNEPAEVVSLAVPSERPCSVAVATDAVKVAFGTATGAVYLWDVLYPTTMESFRTEDAMAAGPISAMAWHPRGHVLAAASVSGVVHLWDMVVGALLFPFPCHDGQVSGLAWTGNGRILLTAGHDGALRAWSPRDVELVGSISKDDEGKDDEDGTHEELPESTTAPSEGSTTSGAAAQARHIRGRKATKLNPNGDTSAASSVRWHDSELTCLDAMVDMSRVALTGGRDGAVLLSVVKPEQGCGVFHAMPPHNAPVTSVKLADLDSSRPLRAASAAEDGSVHLFDIDRRLPMGKFSHAGGPVVKVAFDRTADVLFSAAGPTVHAWDARVAPEEEPPIVFSGHDAKVADFAIVNAGGTLVCACDDGQLRLYDMRYPAGEAPVHDAGSLPKSAVTDEGS